MRKKKLNKIIKELNERVSALTERSKVLDESVDQQGQYSSRNCLFVSSSVWKRIVMKIQIS